MDGGRTVSSACGGIELFVDFSLGGVVAIDFLFDGLSAELLFLRSVAAVVPLPVSDVSPEFCRLRFFWRRLLAALDSSSFGI